MSFVTSQAQDKTNHQKDNMVGLSFLQSMSDITTIVQNKEAKAYIHPTEKRSASKLNEKSLEMCTESLGTETGSESGDDLSLLAFQTTTPPKAPQEHDKQVKSSNKSFPPPIKFVKDSKYNRMVRILGEDGRVVVQAIRVSSPACCFVAERCEGRLRLCLKNNEIEEEEEEEEGMDEENSENLEGKNGNKKNKRLRRRCKENGREAKPVLTWKQEQFWVAT